MTKTTIATDYGIPDDFAGIALQARRADWDNINATDVRERPVYVQADFTLDRQYIGYTIYIRIGSEHHAFEVRGVMTHFFFVPFAEFSRMPNGDNELAAIASASVSVYDFDGYESAKVSALALAAQQARVQHLPRWERDPNEVISIVSSR